MCLRREYCHPRLWHPRDINLLDWIGSTSKTIRLLCLRCVRYVSNTIVFFKIYYSSRDSGRESTSILYTGEKSV